MGDCFYDIVINLNFNQLILNMIKIDKYIWLIINNLYKDNLTV